MKKISNEVKEVLKSSGLFEDVNFNSINADELVERCRDILPKLIDNIPTSNLDRNGYSIFTKQDLDGWDLIGNLNIPFEDVGISPTYIVIKDNRYNTEWHYFGNCISTVKGCYPDIDEEEYWEYFGPDSDESDAPYQDATQMAQALYYASIYLGDKKLINAPPSALQDNVVCGVIDKYNIGFIYNIDEDVHYFFEID